MPGPTYTGERASGRRSGCGDTTMRENWTRPSPAGPAGSSRIESSKIYERPNRAAPGYTKRTPALSHAGSQQEPRLDSIWGANRNR